LFKEWLLSSMCQINNVHIVAFVNAHLLHSYLSGVHHYVYMYIFFRYYMKYSQIGNGVISYGTCTPWGDDAMPRGHTGWYPFHGLVRYTFDKHRSGHLLIKIAPKIARLCKRSFGPRETCVMNFYSLSQVVRLFWNR